jgi:hypothetical protein
VVTAPAEAKSENAVAAKTKEANNLVAKTEVVYEAPGDEKTMFRRVVDKINPFSSSGSEKKEETKKEPEKPKSAVELLAKNKGQKTESKGFFASLWPFGGDSAKDAQQANGAKAGSVVDQVDESLKEKGIDAKTQTAALKTPAVDLPKAEDLQGKPAPDSSKLLDQIDSTLKKEGKGTSEPNPPEAAEVFRNPEMARAATARTETPSGGAPQSSATSGLLGSIDQKLKGKGLGAGNFEPAPTGQNAESKPAPPREINLEPKAIKEKGPLFLNPSDAPAIQQPATDGAKPESNNPEGTAKPEEPATSNISRALVRGPQQPAGPVAPARPDEQKTPAKPNEEKGALEQLQHDLDSVGKLLNPFRW